MGGWLSASTMLHVMLFNKFLKNSFFPHCISWKCQDFNLNWFISTASPFLKRANQKPFTNSDDAIYRSCKPKPLLHSVAYFQRCPFPS